TPSSPSARTARDAAPQAWPATRPGETACRSHAHFGRLIGHVKKLQRAGVDGDDQLAVHVAAGALRAVGAAQVALFALVRVDEAVAAAVGGLAVRRAPLAAGGRVGKAIVRTVVALLACVALHGLVAAERAVLTLAGAAVVLAVAVVHPVAEGVLRRRARGPAIALLAARLDAVAAGGAALRLVGGEPAERELEVRLGRVTVAGEDRDFVGVGRGAGRGRRLEARLSGGQVTLPAIAGGVAGRAGRVELDLGDRIDGVG